VDGNDDAAGRTDGCGKTTIGLQFVLDGMRRGEPGLYVHLEENPTQLGYLIQGFGADPENPDLHIFCITHRSSFRSTVSSMRCSV
jgi:KaiC/GvpD/RAD55 family RecA-like ATPase